MKARIAIAMIAAVTLVTVAKAADYVFPHYFAFHDAAALPVPDACSVAGGVRSIALALDEEQVLQLAYLCLNGTVVIRTDLRPGSGTAVGKQSSAISAHLDAPTGSQVRGLVMGGGWAVECDHRIPQINVLVDGIRVDAMTSRGERKDVSAGNACAGTDAGFSFWLDTSTLIVGAHSVQVQAADDQGLTALSNTLVLMVN
jgi:hypothetical protein